MNWDLIQDEASKKESNCRCSAAIFPIEIRHSSIKKTETSDKKKTKMKTKQSIVFCRGIWADDVIRAAANA